MVYYLDSQFYRVSTRMYSEGDMNEPYYGILSQEEDLNQVVNPEDYEENEDETNI